MSENSNQKALIAGSLGFVVVILAGFAFLYSNNYESDTKDLNNSNTKASQSEDVSSKNITTSEPEMNNLNQENNLKDETSLDSDAELTNFIDGTYNSSQNYQSPGGPDSIQLSLTIENDVIVDYNFSAQASNPTSKGWQSNFESALGGVIKGQKIDNIPSDNIAGSSLTSEAFLRAIAEIKLEARS